MKIDIILAGVGGQGIVTIAAVIGAATLKENLYLKQAETHGMSQRGGAVQSFLRISDKPIFSDLIPLGQADLILSVEPMESLRYLPYLSENGYLVTNATPLINIPNYPDLEELHKTIQALPRHVLIDADKIAKDLGSVRSSNIVMLGAASHYIKFEFSKLEDGIRSIFGKKGTNIVDLNLKALHAGRTYVSK
jgi:indolepyruvate ferredoxin oxidoreductase beta subunit